MASKKAYVDHLRSVPLFSACTRKELERIARSGDEIKMTAGSLLVDQGQTGREAFVILDGTVTVKRNGRKVATLGPGPSSASCRCSTTGRGRQPRCARRTARCT